MPARIRVHRGTVRLAGRARRLARAAHVVAAAAWLGLSVAMTSIALSSLAADDPAAAAGGYELMRVIGTRAIAGAAIATLLTGVLLSAATPWGLLRYRWTVVKTVITAVVIVSAVAVTNGWVDDAIAATTTGAAADRAIVVVGAASHLLLLVMATVVSVDKPGGRTRRATARRPS